MPSLVNVHDLRREFDATFALPPRVEARDAEGLLAIRIADVPYAIRSRDIRGLSAFRKVAPLPARLPEMIGLAAIRGELVPVYGLGMLLGHPRDVRSLRWLAWCGGERRVALAFEDFEGHVQAARSDLHAASGEGERSRHVREVVRIGPTVRPVVGIPSVVEAVHQRVGRAEPAKEG